MAAGLSYVCRASEQALLHQTVAGALDQQIERELGVRREHTA